MKRLLALVALLFITSGVHAVDRSRTPQSVSSFTGDNALFLKVTVSSTSVSTLGAYSTSRGALTCINSDSSNSVYIGSHTAITAAGASSFPLKAGSSIQFNSNAGIFGIADTGVSSVLVYCITEY